MRKKDLLILLLVIAVAFLAGTALATEPTEKDTEKEKAKVEETAAEAPAPQYEEGMTPADRHQGAASIGITVGDTDGTQNRIGEFSVFDGDPLGIVSGQAWGNSGNQFYDATAFYGGDVRDQKYTAAIDFNRNVLFEGSFQRMPHRLDNDPLSYLDAGISTFVVRNTRNDVGFEYGLARSDMDLKADFYVPGAENLKLMAGIDRIGYGGHAQSLVSSKCSNCHITSNPRAMDQVAWDTKLGAQLELDSAIIEYVYKHRSFEDRAMAPTVVFDDPLHPVLKSPVFGNRISYWSRDGELPYAQVADHTKDTHSVRATVGLGADAKLQAGYAHTQTTNQNTNVSAKSNAVKGRVVVPFGRSTLAATARYYDVKVDDIFVDIAEPTALGGPDAGKTYAESYPKFGEADFVRKSVRSRTPTEFILDWRTRLGRSNNLQLTYKYQSIKRENFEVEKTTKNLLRASWRGRAGRQFRFRLQGEYAWIDDPFTAVHSAGPQLVRLDPRPNPFNPSTQYFEMYRSRAWNLSAFPDKSAMAYGMATWAPSGRLSLNAHMRWRDMSNKSLTVSEWSRNVINPGFELWWVPSNQWAVTAGYDYMRDISKTLLSVLAFDG